MLVSDEVERFGRIHTVYRAAVPGIRVSWAHFFFQYLRVNIYLVLSQTRVKWFT